MKEIDVLRDLFDDKIIKVLEVFIENPNKHLSLSEVSEKANVHVATTFRIVNKLVKKEFVRTILIGKSKFYQMKNNPKTRSLFKFLRKEEDFVSGFTDHMKEIPEIKKIILESQESDNAKIIIVGNNIPTQKIKTSVEEILKNNNFKIKFVEMSEDQFNKIEEMDLYELKNKVIWER